MKNGIDLHLHLDGSLSPAYIVRQAKKQGIELPAEEAKLSDYLRAPADCQDLNEYLEKFELPCLILQTEEAVTEAVSDLCRRLKEQGLVYAEIRFAPQLHVKKGLSQRQVVEAAIRGLIQDEEFEAYLILCCMRMNRNEENNLETIKLTDEYLEKGVVAADLAGAEGIYPTSDYQNIFDEAVRRQLPFTIHAGEAAGPESIWAALKLGARRIGHGVRCLEDEKLTAYLRQHEIPLEVCPTSNFQTKVVDGAYPLKALLEQGLCVTLNTDNMTVSDTTLEKEFQTAKEMLKLSEGEMETLKRNAVKAKFRK